MRDVAEVLRDLPAEVGADGFRVELDAPDGSLPMPHGHDDVVCPRDRFQRGGQLPDTERVIAHGGEGRRRPASISAQVTASLRTTTGSSPFTSAKRW
jgi:hypothetical protein